MEGEGQKCEDEIWDGKKLEQDTALLVEKPYENRR